MSSGCKFESGTYVFSDKKCNSIITQNFSGNKSNEVFNPFASKTTPQMNI
tara:strand:- start:1176 stop:1325 length:150 start_codon:yes stop_codon:yes gene_type:complete